MFSPVSVQRTFDAASSIDPQDQVFTNVSPKTSVSGSAVGPSGLAIDEALEFLQHILLEFLLVSFVLVQSHKHLGLLLLTVTQPAKKLLNTVLKMIDQQLISFFNKNVSEN